MKRLLLLPFLCLMPAAQAVDYVKCEAMNKAAGRVRVTAERERVKSRDEYRAQKLQALCGDDPKCKRDNWNHGWDEGLAACKAAEAAQLARLDQIRKDYEGEGCY